MKRKYGYLIIIIIIFNIYILPFFIISIKNNDIRLLMGLSYLFPIVIISIILMILYNREEMIK